MEGQGMQRLIMVNNVLPQSSYGLHGTGFGTGTSALTALAPGALFSSNVIPGQPAGSYPAGNFFPAASSSIVFSSPQEGNYSLSASNSFSQGLFGRIGVDAQVLATKTNGVVIQ